MNALIAGTSTYPGVLGCRLILCWFVVSSTLFGNTVEQETKGVQRKVSGLFPSSGSYNENERNAGKRDSKVVVPLSLDDNDVMRSGLFPSDGGDVEETEEDYVGESFERDDQPSLPNHSVEYEESSVINDSRETYAKLNDDTYQYEEYYDYDYDNVNVENDTESRAGEERERERSNDTRSDKIRTNSTYDTTSMEGSEKRYAIIRGKEYEERGTIPETDKSVLIEEVVVSVVTTKSVVNGTISVPVTPIPRTTEQISSPLSSIDYANEPKERHRPTENSIVLASVQTSRSISGARFLPFPVVEKVEQVALDGNGNTKSSGSSESTESIIDKLDRVQSELSNGFLSSGFRNSGNTLDVLSGTDRTRKSKTTTMRTPVITKFVPHRYNNADQRSKTTTTKSNRNENGRVNGTSSSSSSSSSSTSSSFEATTKTAVIINSTKPRLPMTNKRLSEATFKPKNTVLVPDITAFLPPGYDPKAAKERTESKSILDDIISKTKLETKNDSERSKNEHSLVDDILKKSRVEASSSSLPSGYEENEDRRLDTPRVANAIKRPSVDGILKKNPVDVSSLLPPGFKGTPDIQDSSDPISKESLLADIFKKSHLDVSSFLPPGFEANESNETIDSNSNSNSDSDLVPGPEKNDATPIVASTTESIPATTKAAGFKVVFPTRPGVRKPISRATTPSSSFGGKLGALVPRIHKGWPVRATTEFTGWPSSSTTPISIEKLLEAARTATALSANASSTPTPSMTSTTTTTTTTTTTQRPTTPGICEDECELAGTIRLVGNTTWLPEFLDRNTIEWQQLANEVEKQINAAFLQSNTLGQWYKKIRIDSFSKGSILVDYFVELNEVGRRVDTQELKRLFHDALNVYDSNDENDSDSKPKLALGSFAIDPVSTDFVVVPKFALPPQMDNENSLIPQWAIAVIVIGVGGLLFVIVFGIFVLTNRTNAAKIKPTMPSYDEEIERNIIRKTQPSPIQRSNDYPKKDLYNTDSIWNDKSFDATSNKMMMDGPYQDSSRYNPYDSWKSEWNGYYQNGSHTSGRSVGFDNTINMPRHHHPDYDTNF